VAEENWIHGLFTCSRAVQVWCKCLHRNVSPHSSASFISSWLKEFIENTGRIRIVPIILSKLSCSRNLFVFEGIMQPIDATCVQSLSFLHHV
jgi:hypothetical protein